MKFKSKKVQTAFTIVIFALFTVFCFFLGYFSEALFDNVIPENLTGKDIDNFIGPSLYKITPILSAVNLLGSLIFCVIFYFIGKNGYKKWDGEDERHIEKVEGCLSAVIIVSSLSSLVGMFLMSLWFHQFNVETTKHFVFVEVMMLSIFILDLIFSVAMQRTAVELAKKINPEKQGEVLAHNFQKKWEKSCDEGELLQIYQASCSAYKVGSNICIVLWIVFAFLDMTLNIGFLPAATAIAILLALQITYYVKAAQLQKSKNKQPKVEEE